MYDGTVEKSVGFPATACEQSRDRKQQRGTDAHRSADIAKGSTGKATGTHPIAAIATHASRFGVAAVRHRRRRHHCRRHSGFARARARSFVRSFVRRSSAAFVSSHSLTHRYRKHRYFVSPSVSVCRLVFRGRGNAGLLGQRDGMGWTVGFECAASCFSSDGVAKRSGEEGRRGGGGGGGGGGG